jgi:hypothetical protein
VALGDLAATYDGNAKPASAVTVPSGLKVNLAYDGSTNAPTGAGTYAVIAAIDDTNYTGGASGSLVISKATAGVTLGDLAATYDGNAKPASAVTTPSGLKVNLAYDGLSNAPTVAGTYAVVATVDESNFAGSASGSLVIGKGTASVTLGNLEQTVGAVTPVTVSTVPLGLPTLLTYDGLSNQPTTPGSYAVAASVDDTNYAGSASSTLFIATTFEYEFGTDALDSDTDYDGLSALAEYGLGGSASASAFAQAPVISLAGSNLSLVLIERINDPKLSVTAEVAGDVTFGSQPPVSALRSVLADQTGVPEGSQRVRYSVPQGGAEKLFMKIRFTLDP